MPHNQSAERNTISGTDEDQARGKKQKRIARLKKYQAELDASKEWRKRYEPIWEECHDLYTHAHKHCDKGGDDQDQIMVDLAHAAINIQIAATSTATPHHTIQARKPWHRFSAQVGEEALNHQWITQDFHPIVQDSYWDQMVMGHGWAKVGWRFDVAEAANDERFLAGELDELKSFIDDMVRQGFVDGTDIPSDDELLGEISGRAFRILKDHPTVEKVSIWDIFVDCYATRPWDMRWIAQRQRVPLRDARKKESWKKSVREKLGTNTSNLDDLNTPYRSTYNNDTTAQKPVDYTEVIEYWDLIEGTFCVFADGGEGFLIEPTPHPFKFGHPFIMFRNHDVGDEFYPMGDLECVKDQQYELNRIRSQQLSSLEKYKRQYIAPKRLVNNPEFANAITSGSSDCVIPIDEDLWEDAIANNASPILPIPVLPVPPDAYAMSGQVEDDFYEIMGLSDYFSGGSPRSRTATEAAVANAGQQARDQWKIARLERTISEVARKTFINMQCFMQTQEYARLTGRNSDLGQQGDFLAYDAASIAGEYDFIVEAGSTRPRSEQQRREEALQLMNVVQALAGGIPSLNLEELLRWVLEESFGIRQIDQFFTQVVGQQQPPTAPPGAQGAGPQVGGLGTLPGGPAPIGAGQPQGAQQFPNFGGLTPELVNQLSALGVQ